MIIHYDYQEYRNIEYIAGEHKLNLLLLILVEVVVSTIFYLH